MGAILSQPQFVTQQDLTRYHDKSFDLSSAEKIARSYQVFWKMFSIPMIRLENMHSMPYFFSLDTSLDILYELW